MATQTAETAPGPQGLVFEGDEVRAIDPKEAAQPSAPNQTWYHEGLIVMLTEGNFGMWNVNVTGEDAAGIPTLAGRLRQVLTEFWITAEPDYLVTDSADIPVGLDLLERAGFQKIGAFPLPSGVRHMLGWRLAT
jgi:hypothetical protein